MSEVDGKNLVEEFLLEDNNGNRYRCAGVCVYDSDDQIQIAFNAIDNIVKGFIESTFQINSKLGIIVNEIWL